MSTKINLYKKINLKNIKFNIIFLISLLFFKQFAISNPDIDQTKGDLTFHQDEESPGGKTNPEPDEIIDPYGISSCQNNPNIKNPDCFNNILKFEHKEYQVNNFATNKNGDFLIQYNEHSNEEDESFSSRLFYGITKNGSYFFSNKSSFSHEFNIDIDEEILEDGDFLNLFGIQDSKNLFISFKNDKKNQYLFSINSYNSMVELYDLNNDNNNYQVWNFNKFFNLNEDDYFYPFEFELFELKGKSEYIIAFTPMFIVDEEILDVSFLKRFYFKSLDKDAYEELSSINYKEYLNTKIINIFLLEDSKILGVLAINETILEEDINGGNGGELPINRPPTVFKVGGDRWRYC